LDVPDVPHGACRARGILQFVRDENRLAFLIRRPTGSATFAAFVTIAVFVATAQDPQATNNGRGNAGLCLDGFCIGQTIEDARFDAIDWTIPQDSLTREPCIGVGCAPQVAFRGYNTEYQKALAETLSVVYRLPQYNIITKGNLPLLRQYRYECNPSARGIFGERRFLGLYRSNPSHHLTAVGLRLINGELTVYRIAREFRVHTQDEVVSLARTLHGQYGDSLLIYPHLSSNAYSDVIAQRKDGWFAVSSLTNTEDLADNAAELVLIDPRTRSLLEPTAMPESGDIKPLAVTPAAQCNRSMSVQ
jgi:hypothetical protein